MKEKILSIINNEGMFGLIKNGKSYLRRKFYRDPLYKRFYQNKIRDVIKHKYRRRKLNAELGEGIDVMEHDWDTLIILDSYNANMFEKYSRFEGKYDKKVSKGVWSLEFIHKNFGGKKLHDTVVVTANTWYVYFPSLLPENTFHDLLFIDDYEEIHPEHVTRAAIHAHEKYPNKRVIVHYMQPHIPHIGDISDKYRKKSGEDFTHMFDLFRNGDISKEKLKDSYVETIETVEAEVEKLIESISGKIIITSDHGEDLGTTKNGEIMTQHNNETKDCKVVPWLELPFEQRRKVFAEEPNNSETYDQDQLESHLADLGYK